MSKLDVNAFQAHDLLHELAHDRPGRSDPAWAYPLGNGRLGAWWHGDVVSDRVALCEDSIWARRTPADSLERRAGLTPGSAQALLRVREHLKQGEIDQAQALAQAALLGQPSRLAPYQPAGELWTRQGFLDATAISDYHRTLDLAKAIASRCLTHRGVKHSRQTFASAADQVLVDRWDAGRPGQISLTIDLQRKLDAASAIDTQGRLCLVGQAGAYGTRFAVCLKHQVEGGQVEQHGGRLLIRDADAVTLLISVMTDYRDPDYRLRAQEQVDAAADFTFETLRDRHIESHGVFYNRVQLDLAPRSSSVDADAPRMSGGSDALNETQQLARLFHWGRYLLISSSRPDTGLGRPLPANLQGLWVWEYLPPWNSDYHLNVNIQMAYWPAEVAGLPECHASLFAWMQTLVESGTAVAREHYDCEGWVAHHASDPWGRSTPADSATGVWPMGAAWLCLHLYEHVQFGAEPAFVSDTAWPMMRGACAFFLDYLTENAHGQLVSGPSVSPEHAYRDARGTEGMLCMGPTMDQQIMTALFQATLDVAQRLEKTDPIIEAIRSAAFRLTANQVLPDGTLAEWSEPVTGVEPGHRHVSHTFALFPGWQIDRHDTPDLAKAVQRTLKSRLEHSEMGDWLGWSSAQLACLFARLGEGDQAADMLSHFLKHSVYPNCLNGPPFQIDGNLGVCAAIAEMLVQSHRQTLVLLPACPAGWADGSFTGLRARGGVTASAAWRGGRLTQACVQADRPVTLVCQAGTGQRIGQVTRERQAQTFESVLHCTMVPDHPVALAFD